MTSRPPSRPSSARSRPAAPPPASPLRWLGIAAVVGIVAFFAIREPQEDGPPRGVGGAGGGEPTPAAPAAPPRCHVAAEGYRVGKVEAEDGEAGGGGQGPEPDRFAPFSVEVGRAVALGQGYAVGIKRVVEEPEGASTYAEVAVLGKAGAGDTVRLGRTRPDMDAPVVAASGEGWVAAMLEPHASGLALRLAQMRDGALAWGAELEQARDESLAFDVAFGERAGVVVWDEVSDDGKQARIVVATVDPASLKIRERAAPISRPEVDAELPRLVRRPGGFWLAYVARARTKEPSRDNGEEDDQFRGERIEPAWLELGSLDEDGRLQGTFRPVTPRDGHLLAYDLELGRDGAVIVAWRDDDTPSGAEGGRVTMMLVEPSGAGQEQLVAEDDVGAGVPSLVAGWLALPDGAGHVRLAPVGADGALEGELRQEDAFGIGQVLASRGDELLVAKPGGRAVTLAVLACQR
ncbi:MAG: hypothetical protein R3B72_41600 [Polyangiaceae bacterium]